MRLRYKIPSFSITNYSKLDKIQGFPVKTQIQLKQSIYCNSYNVTTSNQSIFIFKVARLRTPYYGEFLETGAYSLMFLEYLVVSLKDVRRVLFGGNDAPFIRNPCKLPFSTAPRENRA